MKVEIEKVIEMLIHRKEINKVDLSEIEFYRRGKKIGIKKSIIDDWNFTGLHNLDFIAMNLLLESEYNLIEKA